MVKPLALLLRVGPLLYGEEWRKPLADALGVSARALRYWEREEVSPPPDLPQRLLPIIRRQGRELESRLARLQQIQATMTGEEGGDD